MSPISCLHSFSFFFSPPLIRLIPCPIFKFTFSSVYSSLFWTPLLNFSVQFCILQPYDICFFLCWTNHFLHILFWLGQHLCDHYLNSLSDKLLISKVCFWIFILLFYVEHISIFLHFPGLCVDFCVLDNIVEGVPSSVSVLKRRILASGCRLFRSWTLRHKYFKVFKWLAFMDLWAGCFCLFLCWT